MTTVTAAEEPCGCGCACCSQEAKSPEQEALELESLRVAIERRLAELESHGNPGRPRS